MTGRRQAASGHRVTLTAESYARAILAAGELGEGVHAFAERALVEALARHERQQINNGQREARRQALGQSTPGPMRGVPGALGRPQGGEWRGR